MGIYYFTRAVAQISVLSLGFARVHSGWKCKIAQKSQLPKAPRKFGLNSKQCLQQSYTDTPSPVHGPSKSLPKKGGILLLKGDQMEIWKSKIPPFLGSYFEGLCSEEVMKKQSISERWLDQSLICWSTYTQTYGVRSCAYCYWVKSIVTSTWSGPWCTLFLSHPNMHKYLSGAKY